jgi:DNA transformation protein and related proteins
MLGGWATTQDGIDSGPRDDVEATGTRSMTDRTSGDGVLDRLSGLGEVTSRPMFGGRGIYWHDSIFAIQYRDRLYFKVDEQSNGEYLAKGMEPFRPNERQTLKSYYEVPPDVLGDPEALLSWAREAIRAGQSSS